MNKTRQLILKHYKAYPDLMPQDIFKYLYQSIFGCEHMITSTDTVAQYIKTEYANYIPSTKEITEQLDGIYSRVHLDWIDRGLSVETLSKLFLLSSKRPKGSICELEKKLSVVQKMVDDNELPFECNSYSKSLENWKETGYQSLHHSDSFRKNYTPAYRVVASEYAKFLPLFVSIDKMLAKDTALLAIDGGSASGKTTLSELLSQVYDCNVFHIDDFFLQPHQRTQGRLDEIGGNFDRERFLDEVLEPLNRNENVLYKKFDCSSMELLPPEEIKPKKLNVIEGAYSMHTDLLGYYDFTVFMDVTPEVQKKRVEKRNSPDLAERFFNEWIPMEHKYFDGMNVKEKCNMIFKITE